RTDLPVYHPDVRVFDVFDEDGTQLALFYLDPFKRDSKQGGAWMGNFVEQDGLTGAIPVIYNVENFTKPAPGQPALLSFDDVTTLDRKSTRLNSSHVKISYAVFCLKKKKNRLLFGTPLIL